MISRDAEFVPWGRSATCLEAEAKPRKNARLKTNNSFPVNKTCDENRAFLRAFSEKFALLCTGGRPSNNLALFGIFPHSWRIGLPCPVQYGMVTI
jgi:hypothetical protein